MSAVSPTSRAVIWARAAGRCQYPGCNKPLIGDLISGNDDANFGFVAHVIADKEKGPRGDAGRSPLLRDDPANLMLLCNVHHKLVDVDELDKHPESLLLQYKAAHEKRIETLTDIAPEKASHMLLFGSKIGDQQSPLSYARCRDAMLPDWYPVDRNPITIQITGSIASDKDPAFWQTEVQNLKARYEQLIRPRIEAREITHLSVFGLASMPLLIELGSLLGDITPSEVYQLHREPAGWRWAGDSSPVTFRIERPQKIHEVAAIAFGISATVLSQRIHQVLGKDVSIWNVTVDNPHNDVIRSSADLRAFRKQVRQLYNEVKAANARLTEIHIFPAVPVSVAIEIGRTRMPKADLPFVVYDETRGEGFVKRTRVG